MLTGAIRAKEAWGHYWAWDPKETWAAATWFAYLVYIHFFPFNLLLFEPKQIDGHHRRRSQHSISKHIHNDMRGKPRALQSRHQRLIMNLRFEDIDTNKDQ